MNVYPYTILSSAISVDGYLNDTAEKRLLLSHTKDLERVDAVRASCDGILVGANTVRIDNPSLRIRTPSLLEERIKHNKPKHPARITLTSTGNLPASHAFFSDSDNDILVYCASRNVSHLNEVLKNTSAQIINLGQEDINLRTLLGDLKKRGIQRLLIEGGENIATAFLAEGLINELHIAIAPFFVGEQTAPRLVEAGVFPHNKNNRMHLLEANIVGDMAVLTYKLQTLPHESDY